MRIAMVTNTYLPHVGGVANSVRRFTEEYRKRGHKVLVICPEFAQSPKGEGDVVRVPALQNFNGTDFSVALPIPTPLLDTILRFNPEIIHSHHPFLLGEAALRIASRLDVPLVFTHHTMYEQYTHYVPADSPPMQTFAVELSTGYANLCNAVIAPSRSVAQILTSRGVEPPVCVIPTGVNLEKFCRDPRIDFRLSMQLPENAFVVGHVGRLAPEKNLNFLARAVCRVLCDNENAYFLVIGEGSETETLKQMGREAGVLKRLRLAGSRRGSELIAAYQSMDVFAFASKSETQGVVLMEALAAGVPVVALDAPGARDVVTPNNGELVKLEDEERFSTALKRVSQLSREWRRALRVQARQSASGFSTELSAEQALELYSGLIGNTRVFTDTESSVWWRALRRLEAEWEIGANKAGSLARAILPGDLRKPSWRAKISEWVWKRIHRFQAVRNVQMLLGRMRHSSFPDEPGLIMIQIDGLSRNQLEKALRRRRSMPFLRFLLSHEDYHLRTMYSGVPSSTPSVQGELFYGVRQIVPAFNFYDRERKASSRMYNSANVALVERELQENHAGLLEMGSAYGDIYKGGAMRARFCAASLGFGEMLHGDPIKWIALLPQFVRSSVRIAGLVVIELVLAVVDCIRGILDGKHLYKEIQFIPTRVGISTLLRELVTFCACKDINEGLPIIHLNFLGYDEQAHRRGPSSRFAHWTLKGIDSCIKKIWTTAQQCNLRDYQVWIYSDHGQETTIPYPNLSGRTLTESVAAIFNQPAQGVSQSDEDGGAQLRRAELLGKGRIARSITPKEGIKEIDASKIVVTCMGPIGHLYLPEELEPEVLDGYCKLLVQEAKVPLVMRPDGPCRAVAWNESGRYVLPQDSAAVVGHDHPFLEAVAYDLIDLCHHRKAGDIVVSGWTPTGRPVSFPKEHGAHAGPGSEETRAFALLPSSLPLLEGNRGFMRPADLRELALEALGRSYLRDTMVRPTLKREPRTLRIMTYNVHSCIGTDGRLSPARIAKVIAYFDPDIISLQELDVGRRRTGRADQVEELAQLLQYNFHFHPALEIKGELYGDAILSRYPLRLFKAGPLPTVKFPGKLEPRGALWVEVDVNGTTVQVVNTHLGLIRREREAQAEALVGTDWLTHPHCKGPTILCGDFNAVPNSKVYQKLSGKLSDVQSNVRKAKPRNTWQSTMPLCRIDHIFVSSDVEVINTLVPANSLTKITSDHLPLIADLRLPR